jgi:hypothetical protein
MLRLQALRLRFLQTSHPPCLNFVSEGASVTFLLPGTGERSEYGTGSAKTIIDSTS